MPHFDNFSSQFLHFHKKIPTVTVSRTLDFVIYYRVNNRHGGRMERAKVGYLTKIIVKISSLTIPGRVAQSVTCLATDACLTADQGVASSIPARFHTFIEIDHEIIFIYIP